MTSDQVAVLFIAGRHAFAGAMDHCSSRVLDVLNSANTEFLRVHNASVFRGTQRRGRRTNSTRSPCRSRRSTAWCSRRNATKRRCNENTALVEKPSHSAFVLLEHYELRGKVMIGRNFDSITLLNGGASCFFPMVSVTISSVEPGVPTISAKVVFVNKTKVSLLQIDDHADSAVPIMKKKVERKGVEPSTSALRTLN